ncbi:N-acetylmuramoyl-L-alanine amidase [Sphingomonas paucimobilis]|uniref:N-acetylmuramoyl-L-alanine amidase n=1 Tax=Sphingomonas paucimobilis TaxID=13689 RepID=UPI0030F95E41
MTTPPEPWRAAARARIARPITSIAVHCTATPAGRPVTVAEIRAWHKAEGYSDIGYHFVVGLDGQIAIGRPKAIFGAHVRGFNAKSVGVVYVGGIGSNGKPLDTRTPEQKVALLDLLGELKRAHPAAVIKGHRDYSPDRNGDGKITPDEWLKACPCFDAQTEYARVGLPA